MAMTINDLVTLCAGIFVVVPPDSRIGILFRELVIETIDARGFDVDQVLSEMLSAWVASTPQDQRQEVADIAESLARDFKL